MKTLNVLAISGSLRKASLNTAMLRLAAGCAPTGVRVTLGSSLGELPLFNPDLESNEPVAVTRLRHEIASANALLIASPEYAHGVSGVMKNALDWMVGSSVFVDKPVAVWNASPRASIALAALRETLTVMSARLIATATLEWLITPADAAEPAAHPGRAAMQAALRALGESIESETSRYRSSVSSALVARDTQTHIKPPS